MGRRLSLLEDFARVKTLMGLEQFEVRFFFREKFIKLDLAKHSVTENFSKLTKKVF